MEDELIKHLTQSAHPMPHPTRYDHGYQHKYGRPVGAPAAAKADPKQPSKPGVRINWWAVGAIGATAIFWAMFGLAFWHRG